MAVNDATPHNNIGYNFKGYVLSSKRRIICAVECGMAVQGHPRSLILESIESAHMTSY